MDRGRNSTHTERNKMTQQTENLDLLSDILQILNTYLLLRDATNNQLMQELNKQDKVYFERIIKDLDLIKKHLNIKEES